MEIIISIWIYYLLHTLIEETMKLDIFINVICAIGNKRDLIHIITNTS